MTVGAFLALLLFGFIGFFFVKMFQTLASIRAMEEKVLKPFAARTGLTFAPRTIHSSARAYGRLSDIPVSIELHPRPDGFHTLVTSSTRHLMPADMLVGQLDIEESLFQGENILVGHPEIDHSLRCHASEEERLVTLFTHAPLRTAIRPLTNGTSASMIRGEEITLGRSGVPSEAELEDLVQDIITLAAELDRGRVRDSLEVAEQLSLSVEKRSNMLWMHGTHREQTVEVAVNLHHDTTTITVPLSGLPQQFSIVAGKQADAVRLGDPILDGMVSVRTEHPEQIAALLRDDALRGVLLAVVHAWPKSTVTNEHITLHLPHVRSSELEARLEEVTTLAAGLTRARPTQDAQRAAQRKTVREGPGTG